MSFTLDPVLVRQRIALQKRLRAAGLRVEVNLLPMTGGRWWLQTLGLGFCVSTALPESAEGWQKLEASLISFIQANQSKP